MNKTTRTNILLFMRKLLKKGWNQGPCTIPPGSGKDVPLNDIKSFCFYGAAIRAEYEITGKYTHLPEIEHFINSKLSKFNIICYGENFMFYNETRGRTKEQVLNTLNRIIKSSRDSK